MARRPGRHVALLRGINVGAHNRVPMAQLAEMFERAGCADVETYIRSGNVVFRAPAAVARRIPARIERAIADELGLDVAVLTRAAREIRTVARNNPFPTGDAARHKLLHVAFLRERPAPARVAALDPDRSPPDAFEVRGREVYFTFPGGAHRSRLTTAWLDRALGTLSTWRNWRTVLALAEMVA